MFTYLFSSFLSFPLCCPCIFLDLFCTILSLRRLCSFFLLPFLCALLFTLLSTNCIILALHRFILLKHEAGPFLDIQVELSSQYIQYIKSKDRASSLRGYYKQDGALSE